MQCGLQPSIEFLGVLIQEPVTTFTDLVVSAVCFYAFSKVRKMQGMGKMYMYYTWYFFIMGLATTFGGLIGHGFLYIFGFTWKLAGWLISMFAITLIERAAIEQVGKSVSEKVLGTMRIINWVELAIFLFIVIYTLNFFMVQVHSAYGLLFVVTSLQSFSYIKTRSKGSKYTLIAVGISALAALVFLNEWKISRWFNHYDISHTIMAVCAWYFYLGVKFFYEEDSNKVKE